MMETSHGGIIKVTGRRPVSAFKDVRDQVWCDYIQERKRRLQSELIRESKEKDLVKVP